LSNFLALKPRPGDGPPTHFRQPPRELPGRPRIGPRATCSYMDKPRSRRPEARCARVRTFRLCGVPQRVKDRSRGLRIGRKGRWTGGARVLQNSPQGAVSVGLVGSFRRCSLPISVTYPEASTDANLSGLRFFSPPGVVCGGPALQACEGRYLD
jgi:hypothetical protein